MNTRIIILTFIAFSFCIQSAFGQYPYEKSKAIYFNIEGLNKGVPYTKWNQNLYLLNDSNVYDIRYKKLLNRLYVVGYKKKEYYGKGYAAPISSMKYKVNYVGTDTAIKEDINTTKLVYSINKYYDAKLIKK